MDETESLNRLSPYVCGGSGLADAALGLVQVLQEPPEDETPSGAALRKRLAGVALGIADRWSSLETPADVGLRFNLSAALWRVRSLGADLGVTAGRRPQSLIVLEALRDAFLPGAHIAYRSGGLATISVREQLSSLDKVLERAGLPASDTDDEVPSRLLAVRMPLGEEEHALATLVALPYFDSGRSKQAFSASNGGPAYFFAKAAEVQNCKGFTDAFDPPKLCFIAELLETSGWRDHPIVGPLMGEWCADLGLGPNYLDKIVLKPEMLAGMRAVREAYRSEQPAYTPDDFDRETPALWDRIRGLEPLTDIRSGAPVSASPPWVICLLNAAWTFAQLHFADLCASNGWTTNDEQFEARRLLNRLVAEGIAGSTPTRSLLQPPVTSKLAGLG